MGSLPPFFLPTESELLAAEAAASAAKTSEVGSLIGVSASTTLPLSAPVSTTASLPLASVEALRDADSMSSQSDSLRLLSVYRESWGRPTFRSRRGGGLRVSEADLCQPRFSVRELGAAIKPAAL